MSISAERLQCAQAAELEFEPIVQSLLGKQYNFSELAQDFDRIKGYFAMVAICESFDLLPVGIRQTAASPAEALVRFSRETLAFNASMVGHSEQQRLKNQFAAAVRNAYEHTLDAIGIAAGLQLLADRRSVMSAFEDEARTIVGNLKEESQKAVMGIDGTRQSAMAKLAEVESAAAKVLTVATSQEISAHQAKFNSEAKTHGYLAILWLVVLAGLAGGSLRFAYVLFDEARNAIADPPPGIAIQLAITKVAFLALLGSLIIWAGKMYRSSVHNQIVNKHRSNALATFETFVNGAPPEIRAAVLLQTTSCIFAPQATGLVSAESEPHPSSYLADLARVVSSTKTSQ